jgi:hypothetical protein
MITAVLLSFSKLRCVVDSFIFEAVTIVSHTNPNFSDQCEGNPGNSLNERRLLVVVFLPDKGATAPNLGTETVPAGLLPPARTRTRTCFSLVNTFAI